MQGENLNNLEFLIGFILSKSQLENKAETGQLNSEEKAVIEKIDSLLKELQNSLERIQTSFQDWQDFDNL